MAPGLHRIQTSGGHGSGRLVHHFIIPSLVLRRTGLEIGLGDPGVCRLNVRGGSGSCCFNGRSLELGARDRLIAVPGSAASDSGERCSLGGWGC